VREEESIPELEEDDAVVKQVAGEFSAPQSGATDAARSAASAAALPNQPTKCCPTTSRSGRSGEYEVLVSNFGELLELQLFFVSQYIL